MAAVTFINAEWNRDVVLGNNVLRELQHSNARTIALFASVQFLRLDKVKKQLKDAGIGVETARAKRAHADAQLLGCDLYSDSFEKDIIVASDALLYIGDGLFHPKALLMAQAKSRKMKPVLVWNPVNERMKILTKDDIAAQLRKIKANLKLFIAAETIGIIATTKPGQQYLNNAKMLKQRLAKQGKKAYIFLADTIDYSHLENFPSIKVWVNTACPRIGTDDITSLQKPIVNIREAMDPLKALEEFSAW